MFIVSVVRLATDEDKLMPQRRGIVVDTDEEGNCLVKNYLNYFPEGWYPYNELIKCHEIEMEKLPT